MTLVEITEQKYWERTQQQIDDARNRLNFGQASFETIQLLYSVGCGIKYYWNTHDKIATYQAYMGQNDN